MLTTKYEPRYALRIAATPLLKMFYLRGSSKDKGVGLFRP